MITIKDFLETVDYKITDGCGYQWRCYGDNARFLDSEYDHCTVSIVVDTANQTVYEFTVNDYTNERDYRWIHPDFRQVYFQESKLRLVDGVSLEDLYQDLDVADDILKKARAIVLGEHYDTTVLVPLELEHDEIYELMIQAHEQDITLNQLVTNILEKAIADEPHQPELF